MELGDRIRELRTQKNLTQEDLAKQLHITRQTISKWESNKSIPDIMCIKELCQIFEISVDEFLSNATYQKKKKKYYYVLLMIGLMIYVLPYLAIVYTTLTHSLTSSFLIASYTVFFQKISYAFIIASICLFLFDKYK